MKKVSIILFIMGFLLIFSGLGVGFISDLNKDREETLIRMEDVKNEYKNFSNSVDSFNDIRNSLYLTVFEDVYFDTMASNDATVKQTFTDYETSVNGVKDTVEKLSNLCGDIYFFNDSVNEKCKSFSSVYEQIVNAFVSDVALYNDNILQYNQYQSDLGTNNTLENYVTEKKYIDYNNDKEFEGKEE